MATPRIVIKSLSHQSRRRHRANERKEELDLHLILQLISLSFLYPILIGQGEYIRKDTVYIVICQHSAVEQAAQRTSSRLRQLEKNWMAGNCLSGPSFALTGEPMECG
eukprot:3238629-Rhodomonas_salina.1